MAQTQSEQAVSETDVCQLVTQASRLLALTISEPLCRLGVTPGQLGTLLELYRGDGRTQAELARAVGVEQPTMALTLRRMERDGLITREPDPHDRRRALVTLTPTALAASSDIQELRQEIATDALAGFTDQERVTFKGMIDRLVANLERDRGPSETE